MKHEVKTEGLRIAIARHERDEALLEIKKAVGARFDQLAALHGVEDEAELLRLAETDREIRDLALEAMIRERIYEVIVDRDCNPMLGEPGEPIRWKPPEHTKQRVQ